MHSENTRFIRASITVQLTYYFICLVSGVLLLLNEQPIYLFGKVQTSQTGQLYNDASSYKVSWYSPMYLYTKVIRLPEDILTWCSKFRCIR